MGLADLLYLRKTDKDIAELESIAKKENTKDTSFRIQSEIAFHGKLYDMTGNDTLKRFQIMLLPIFDYVVTIDPLPTRGAVSHLDLVEILRSGSQEDFKKGMREHLLPHFDRIK
jgi:GntR family transcriptional regulator, transcriptional repressor for pyruvate dehydrogenase complex